MSEVKEHYEQVLANVYSWMFGGFDSGVSKNREFFRAYEIHPKGSKVAVDLGAGCGFQAIPLSELGFTVTAIDLSQKLLDELTEADPHTRVKTVCDDLVNFQHHVNSTVELVVCMTDTLVHLESKNVIALLFERVFSSLGVGGQFILTFRDLSQELFDLDRFFPVRSDKNTIMTCFLEYEEDHVKVNDVVYKNSGDFWEVKKSFYRKLRLSKQWVDNQLKTAGFELTKSDVSGGMVTVIATKTH
jgi:ubiquinone/menaquinone biosynthesis C-methylase UbiE